VNDSINEIIRNLVTSALGNAEGDFVVEHPTDLLKGDYSTNAALVFAKILKKNPVELAKEIVENISSKLPPEISKVETAGPGFINFYLSQEFFDMSVKEIAEKGKEFGKNKKLKAETWAVEYASPNPNKAMHVGHVRNVITGVSLCNLLESNGATVIREMVDNNRGIAIAKLMWGYLVSAKKDGSRIEDISYWKEHKG
jgi:arginyl-tRNA synthetase